MGSRRRAELCELGVLELVERILRLEADNEALRGALAPLCGALRAGRSCQLPRHHGGVHAWAALDGAELVRW